MTLGKTSIVRRKDMMLCLAPPIIYFGITFPSLVLLGIEPPSHYYNLASVAAQDVAIVFLLNVLFCGLALYFFYKHLPEAVAVPRIGSWVGIIGAILIIWFFFGSNWDLSRDEVKSSASILRAVGISGASAYLGAVVITTDSPRKLLVACIILVVSIFLSWERDQILYLLFPLLIRLGQLRLRPVVTLILAASGATLLLGYKFIVIEAKSLGGFQIGQLLSGEFWGQIGRSFMLDNLHKSMIEVSYISGDHPDYSILSYFRPLQLERLFDPTAMTNGQMATYYYTAGKTGTGFSALLESWLNLGPFGLVVVPYFIARALGLACARNSSLWIVALLVFMAKLQRSDLWPAVIAFLLGPLAITALSWIAKRPRRARQGASLAVSTR